MPDKRVTELTAIDAVADLDLLMVIDDPAGSPVNKKATVTQLLATAARTNASNTFTGDQTVDGDLFVTGEVNPARFAAQLRKIDLFTETPVGDPAGSRTLLSRSLVSGLSLRHDEALAEGRLAVGNYDTQVYQPLKIEVESFQIHTGISPGTREERLRVHPSGGVTVGMNHVNDPGGGSLAADAIDLKEGITLDPPTSHTGRLYALDVNGYTQVEMRDANANVVRFASDNIIIAKVTGAPITRGQSVYLAGATGANPLVGLARADALATMPSVGLALDSGAVNAFIRVLVGGTLQLLNTSAFAEGARLYVSPTTAGSMTTTPPVAPDFAQRVGFVTRSHATQGEVLVVTTAVEGDPRLHHTTHEPGGSDALTNLDAGILTGTVSDARLSANVALRGFRNTFTQYQTIAPPPNEPGMLVIRDMSGEGAILNFTDGSAPADRKTYYMKSQGGGFTIMQANDIGGNISALQWYGGSLYMYAGVHSIYPHGLYFGSSTSMQPADPCVMATPDTLEFKRYDGTDRITLLAKGFGTTPLDASQLLSGTIPDARLSANVQMKPVPPPTVSAASRLLGRGASGAGAMEEITLGTGLTMSGTTLNAEGGSTLPPTVAYTDQANTFTKTNTFTSPYPQILLNAVTPLIQFFSSTGVVDARRWDFYGGDDFVFQATKDDGTLAQSVPLAFHRNGNVDVGGDLTVSKATARLILKDTAGAVNSKEWRLVSEFGNLGIYPVTDAGVVQATTVQFFRNGNTEWYSPVKYYDTARFNGNVTMDLSATVGGSVAVGGILQVGGATHGSASLAAIRSTGTRLDIVRGDQATYASLYCLNIGAAAGGNSLPDLTVTGAVSLQGTVAIAGVMDVTGGSGTGIHSSPIEIILASHPRIGFHWPGVVASSFGMDSAGVLRTYDNPGTGYERFACLNIYAPGTSNTLGDLTVVGGTNFAGGLTVSAGGGSITGTLVVNAVSVNAGNITVAGNYHSTAGYIYPGNAAAGGAYQGSWYLGSHSSFGLYANTGLYCVGDVWASGVSVAGSLAGKHPLMTASGGLGTIGLQYGTMNAIHALTTQLAAPAGGTGTAAGGWSTAANRDLAIASINAARTDILNIKQVMTHLMTSLKNMGILLP